MPKGNWTPAEQRAIDANPDLDEELAAAFADELNVIADATGGSLAKALGIRDHEEMDRQGFPPAKPGSIQELCPWLRDPNYV